MTNLRQCAGCGEIIELDADFVDYSEFPYFCDVCSIALDPEDEGVDPDGDHLVGPSPYPDQDIEDL